MTRSKRQQLLDALVLATRDVPMLCSHDHLETLGGDELLDIAHDLTSYVEGVFRALDALDAHLADLDERKAAHNVQDTSIAAAAMVVPKVGYVRRRIIDEIRTAGRWNDGAGYTDSELERRLKVKHETLSSARNWLTGSGWLMDSGLRRESSSGRDAIVWALTPAALAVMSDPSWVARSA